MQTICENEERQDNYKYEYVRQITHPPSVKMRLHSSAVYSKCYSCFLRDGYSHENGELMKVHVSNN